MRKFRINNDVPVIWRIVEKQTLMPFDLEGKTVKVALQNRFGIVPIEEFDVSGNVISFIFKAAQQGWLGVYTATVSIVDSEGQTWTVDDCQMLELVARSCCVDVCDCQGVNATSCVEFAQFIIVDQELEEGSTNPVAGGPVAEAINSLGNKLNRMATEQGVKNETFEQGIENNKRRVFKYHVDVESETLAVIETGEDWINNSAVLDWLFRNGAEGVDRAEANVPCVVITPVDGIGFTQNILGSTNAIWGEEDGLVYFSALFSSQITQVLASLNAYYSRAEGSTTWNKNQLEVGNLDLQTVEDNPVERGNGNYSLQQKAEPNNENNASGLCSTAFGHSNEATEHCSYAEGYDNASGGWASHVEGVGNTATSDAHFSHVGGTESVAGHTCAFVHGRGLRSADEQAVFGKYNAFSPSEAFVVGWGESDERRRNVFSVPKSETGTAKVLDESIVTETKSIAYADLVSLRNSHRLVPGRFYRITDYVTATVQEKTSSAGHPFDVIVLALDKNVLSEEAWAIDHSGDTYFKDAGANLSAWKIWYCLDNDKERFAWAAPSDGLYPQISLTAYGDTTTPFRESYNDRTIDGTMYYAYRQNGGANQLVYFRTEVPSTGDVVYNSSGQAINDASVTVEMISGQNGMGVIYRMIDEWDNDLPYDFKNIKYQLDVPIVSVVVAAYGSTFSGSLTRNTSIDTSTGAGAYYGWDYKITSGPGASGTVYAKTLDLSEDTVFYSTQTFLQTDVVKVTSEIYEVYTFGKTADNSIAGESHHNRMLPYKSYGPLELNRITFGNNCYSNSLGNNCSSNSFGNNCYSNSLGNNCSSNSFGNNCSSNSLGDSCSSNSLGNNCDSNSFGDSCSSNSLGDSCSSNSLGDYCSSNSFGDYCSSNSLGDYCDSNSFGDSCSSNSLGNNCDSNSFGDSCYSNSFGDYCSSNSLGDYCSSNSLGDSCSSNSLGNNCDSNSFGDSCSSNSLGDSCYSNSLGNNCDSNSLGDSCSSNSLGDSCSSNSFGDYCSSNSLGDSCSSNSFGDYCSSNSLGDYCENIEFVGDIEGASGEGSYFSYNTFDPGVKYIKVVRTTVPEPSAVVSGLKLTSGVAGESSNNPYTISTSASYNGNSFTQITFAVNSNGEIVSYNTADLAALIS